jgi:glycyl-tRNA synthetase beta chain
VTVAVSLADKLDTIVTFFFEELLPTGSKDPFALRRASLAVLELLSRNGLRLPLKAATSEILSEYGSKKLGQSKAGNLIKLVEAYVGAGVSIDDPSMASIVTQTMGLEKLVPEQEERVLAPARRAYGSLREFFADRLKVQQREAGVRHDLIDAVFALGGEDDLVRLLARVRALQSFVETPEGRDLLAGYKRAANILKKEGYAAQSTDRHPGLDPGSTFSSSEEDKERWMPDQVRGDTLQNPLSYTPLDEEQKLIAALDSAEPRARAAVAAEDFEGAMAALASLRAPVDAFFDKVTVNDPDPAKREARLALLARMRAAVHAVADFSRIEG